MSATIKNLPEEDYDNLVEKIVKDRLKKEEKKKSFYKSKKFNKYIGDIKSQLKKNYSYLECDHTYVEQEDGTPVDYYSTAPIRDNEKILLNPERFSKLSASISLYSKQFVIPDGMCSTYFVIYEDLVFETILGQGSKSYVYYIKEIKNNRIKNEINKHLLNKKLKKIK